MSRADRLCDTSFVPLHTASCSVDSRECGAEGAETIGSHVYTRATLTHAPDRAFKRTRQQTQDSCLPFRSSYGQLHASVAHIVSLDV